MEILAASVGCDNVYPRFGFIDSNSGLLRVGLGLTTGAVGAAGTGVDIGCGAGVGGVGAGVAAGD